MFIAKLLQIIKVPSAYIFFRICPKLKLRYPKGHFWSEGSFFASCGSDSQRVYSYIKNQELHPA